MDLLHHFDLVGRYDLSRRDMLASGGAAAMLAALVLPVVGAAGAVASGALLFAAALIAIIDSRHFVIPDAVSLPLIPFGLAAAATCMPGDPVDLLVDHALAAAVAAGALYAVRFVYFRVRGIEGLGLGDVKLAGAAGAWVGLEALALTCLLASVAALAAVLVLRLKRGGGELDPLAPVPFGCFIAPAIVVVWLYNLLGI